MDLSPVEELIVRLRSAAAAGTDVILVDLAAARAFPLMLLRFATGLRLGLGHGLLIRLKRLIAGGCGIGSLGSEEGALRLSYLDKGKRRTVHRGQRQLIADHRAVIQVHCRLSGFQLHHTVFKDLIEIEHGITAVLFAEQSGGDQTGTVFVKLHDLLLNILFRDLNIRDRQPLSDKQIIISHSDTSFPCDESSLYLTYYSIFRVFLSIFFIRNSEIF